MEENTLVNFSERENQLDSMLNSIPSLISYIDSDLRYQFMNKAYEEWFGITTASAIGRTIPEILGEEAYKKLKGHISAALSGEKVSFESEIPYRSGSALFIEATYTPDIDKQGQVKGFTALVHNITERKRSETRSQVQRDMEALRKSGERYHRMIDEIQDYAIILLNKDGTIENWNKGAEKIKGYREDEIIGKHIRIFYTKEDRENQVPEKLIEEVTRNGKAIHEGWRVRKDGTIFWASTIISALRDNDNSITGFSKVTRDLTERKQAEDMQKQYTSRLEFQNKELEQFAYAASHDLQEPLRKIRAFNERILRTEQLSEAGRDYFNRSVSAAKRMQKLIDDLLSYSRATLDARNFEWVDLNKVKEEVLTGKKETIEEKMAIVEATGTLPVIYAIPFQVRQLLDNLLGNCLKYAHPQRPAHVTIHVEQVAGTDVPYDDADRNISYHKLIIADNGIGFEQEYAEKIFDIFQRLHGHSQLPGSGIGLAICKKIIKNHKGFIRATGKPNEGATFEAYLPS